MGKIADFLFDAIVENTKIVLLSSGAAAPFSSSAMTASCTSLLSALMTDLDLGRSCWAAHGRAAPDHTRTKNAPTRAIVRRIRCLLDSGNTRVQGCCFVRRRPEGVKPEVTID